MFGAGGGAAEEAGFMISSNDEGTVVGFSLDGATIPAGENTLVYLAYASIEDQACLSDVVLSDSDGQPIEFTTGDCIEIDYVPDDGPPACLLDCEGLDEINPDEDVYGFCEWITNLDECISDCDGEDGETIDTVIGLSLIHI